MSAATDVVFGIPDNIHRLRHLIPDPERFADMVDWTFESAFCATCDEPMWLATALAQLARQISAPAVCMVCLLRAERRGVQFTRVPAPQSAQSRAGRR